MSRIPLPAGRQSYAGAAWCFAWLLALFCLNSPLLAQYGFTHWTAEDGLPPNDIRGIFQDPDGYLWISTLGGLSRFDGVHFTLFDKSNTPGIPTNMLGAMYGSPDGDLWLDAEGNGLMHYHQGEFHTYGSERGITDLRGITGDSAGHMWILSGNTIGKWENSSKRFVDITPANLKLQYHVLRWEDAGFWAVDKSELHCFVRGHFLTYPLPHWLNSDPIWGVGIDQDGIAWLETIDGKQARLVPGEVPTKKPLDPGMPVIGSYRDLHGHFWKIIIGRRLVRSIEYPTSGSTATLSFSRIYEDHDQNLWLGTEDQGLYRLQKQSVQVYSKRQGLGSGNVYPIFQDHTGAIWIGTWYSGLSRFENGRFTNYTVADGLPNDHVSALGEDRSGNLWIGTHGGLTLFTNGRFHRPAAPSLPDDAVVLSILQDRNGTLWLGTRIGLFSYKDNTTRLFTEKDGLAGHDVHVLIEDSSGNLWMGTHAGLTRLHNGQFTHWTERDGLPSNNIRSLYEDRDGILWIGTYDGGLARFKDGKFTRYSMREGLFDDSAFQILEGANGNLWISCNRGIYRVKKQELNEYAAGARSTITSIAYGKGDGMLNVQCNSGFWPAGIKARDGKLWFPTQDGVAVIDPDSIRYNPHPPSVMIESLVLDRMPVSISKPVRIPPGKEALEIQYTGLSFVNSKHIQFRYKLEGLDSNWVEAGSRRTAYYSHLPPGKYIFHVIACNSDGVWNTTGKSLAITVLAPFYRTWWFIALIFFAFAAFIWMAWRRHLARLQQSQATQQAFARQLIASQENERKRIAAELHDSIGQRLVVINNLALFFLRSYGKTTTKDHDGQPIQEISEEAVSAIEETRQIAYNLRPFQLDRLGLTKAIESMIRTISTASEIHIFSQIDNIDDLFAEDLRINFYRIVQESLNNVIKHARATEVHVHIERSEEQVHLSVYDNGRGFVPGTRLPQNGQSGFGLTGMTERTHLLGGELKIQSAPGDGTMLIVDIPLTGGRRG